MIRSDLLWESFAALMRTRPWQLCRVVPWLLRGRAHLKAQLAGRTSVDVASLPYHGDLLAYLAEQRRLGRRVVLATAAEPSLAHAVAEHLGLFDEVVTGDGTVNLKGSAKRTVLECRYGRSRFDYIGDSRADLPVWEAANAALLVEPGRRLERAVTARARVTYVFARDRRPLRSWTRQLRVHQWAKNLLIFVPLVAAHRLGDGRALAATVMAFLAFCFGASAIYVLNDVIDLPSDRLHVRKRFRPLASGAIAIPSALAMAALLVGLSIAVAACLPGAFATLLGVYLLTSLGYSLFLKKKLMIDVICLAGLYTLRILSGGAATGIVISTWLMAFSMFLFLSLAFLKRYTELQAVKGRVGRLPGRGYCTEDLDMIRSLGPASGYVAVLVVCLYLNDPASVALYRHPRWLLLVCPLLLYWISRVWLLAQRGKMHSDPVVFALKDHRSLVTGGIAAAIIAAATWL